MLFCHPWVSGLVCSFLTNFYRLMLPSYYDFWPNLYIWLSKLMLKFYRLHTLFRSFMEYHGITNVIQLDRHVLQGPKSKQECYKFCSWQICTFNWMHTRQKLHGISLIGYRLTLLPILMAKDKIIDRIIGFGCGVPLLN